MTLRALIAGYYGAGNAGDEVILEALLSGLRRLKPEAEASVLSYDPEATRLGHGVETISWDDLEALQDAIRWSSLVIVGGGGLWQDYWGFDSLGFFGGRPGGIAGYGTPILLAHLLGRPSVMLGAGVGPLNKASSREAVRDLALLATFVSVRDTSSRRLLVECGVPADHVQIGADLAFLAGPPPRNSIVNSDSLKGRPVLGVSIRPWDQVGDAWEAEVIRALGDWHAQTGGSVLLVPLHESSIPVENDRALAERVASRLPETSVSVAHFDLAPHERLSLLGSTDVVLGMRYHAVVAALQAQVPCVGLAYDPKVRSLMDEASLGSQALPLEDLAASALVERLLWATRTRKADPRVIENLRSRAEESLSAAILHAESIGAPAPPSLLPNIVLGQARLLNTFERALVTRLGHGTISGGRAERGLELVAAAEAESVRQQERAEAAEERLAEVVVENRAATAALEGQLESERGRVAEALRQLAALRSTTGVRILDRYWQWLRRSAPEGSTRRRIYSRVRGLGRVNASGAVWGPGGLRRNHPDRWRVGRNSPTPADEEWLAAVSTFIRDPNERAGTLILLAPTRCQVNEGQRSYHLANEFARLGWRVVFGYWRWGVDDSKPAARPQPVLEVPLDVLLVDVDRVLVFPGREPSLLLMEFPFPGFFRLVAAANGIGMVTVYDMVDDWRAFAHLGQAPWYDERYERSLGTAADVLTAVSPKLARIAEARCGRKPGLVPNAAGPGLGAAPLKCGSKRSGVTLGYFGHLTESWFDWDLVLQTASRKPDWQIELIGYGADWRTSRLPPNVHFLGKVPRGHLAKSSADWDVAIIPFREGDAAKSADPIKAYEYLSLGLPVVATGVDAPPGAEGLIRKVRGADEFVRAVEFAAKTRSTNAGDRLAYAMANSWEHRVKELLAYVEISETGASLKRDFFRATS